jgi:hypothetical protein
MKAKPPQVATWLLRRFGHNSTGAAIIGDLSERYQSNRSRRWYWKQVLAAIAIGYWKVIRAHKLEALRAVVTGFAAIIVYDLVVTRPLDSAVVLPVRNVFLLLVQLVGSMWSGWIIVRFHHVHKGVLVSTYLACVVVWSLGLAITSVNDNVVSWLSRMVFHLPAILFGAGLLRSRNIEQEGRIA